MELKDRLKEMRLARGMTLEGLAKAVGTSKQTIHRYETGAITNIPSDKIEAIANALKTTPAYLMGWEQDETNYVAAYRNMLDFRVDGKIYELQKICANLDDRRMDRLLAYAEGLAESMDD